jgi:hypothetical protein
MAKIMRADDAKPYSGLLDEAKLDALLTKMDWSFGRHSTEPHYWRILHVKCSSCGGATVCDNVFYDAKRRFYSITRAPGCHLCGHSEVGFHEFWDSPAIPLADPKDPEAMRIIAESNSEHGLDIREFAKSRNINVMDEPEFYCKVCNQSVDADGRHNPYSESTRCEDGEEGYPEKA